MLGAVLVDQWMMKTAQEVQACEEGGVTYLKACWEVILYTGYVHAGVAEEKSGVGPGPFKPTANPVQQYQGSQGAQPNDSTISDPFKSWASQVSAQQQVNNSSLPAFPTFQSSSATENSGGRDQPQENGAAPVFSFGSAAPTAPTSAASSPNGFNVSPGNKYGRAKERSRRRNLAGKCTGRLVNKIVVLFGSISFPKLQIS